MLSLDTEKHRTGNGKGKGVGKGAKGRGKRARTAEQNKRQRGNQSPYNAVSAGETQTKWHTLKCLSHPQRF